MAGRETIARLLSMYTLRGHHKMIGEREYQLLQAHLLPEVRGYHTGSVKRLLSFPTRLHRARGCGLETFKKFCNQRFVSKRCIPNYIFHLLYLHFLPSFTTGIFLPFFFLPLQSYGKNHSSSPILSIYLSYPSSPRNN